VILVVVGHQQRVDAAQVQAEPQRVAVRVGRKVDQQLVVDQRARAGADVLAAPFARAAAGLAVAEQGRPALGRRGP